MSELLKINVNEHTERKNGLTYLSWAWAWAEVLKVDAGATWMPLYFGVETNQTPYLQLPDGSMMVGVSVTIKGDTKSCLLPVMNHRNQAIKNPDAFALNTALMRCLAKAIAMHGLGLYIYAGEDLPESEKTDDEPQADQPGPINRTLVMKVRSKIQEHIANGRDLGVLEEWDFSSEQGEEFGSGVWSGLTTPERDYIRNLQNQRKKAA